MSPIWLVPWTAAVLAAAKAARHPRTRQFARWFFTIPPHPAQTPAGQEDAAKPPSPRPARPAPTAVPAPPGAHPGTLIVLAAMYQCDAGGQCVWVWRGQERGWQHEKPCVKPPTSDQWDVWKDMIIEWEG